MMQALSGTWPWYVSGPLIGLMVPLLLLGGRLFGVSSNLRHICSATLGRSCEYFDYDWKSSGLWNLAFIAGALIGGLVAGTLLSAPDAVIGIAEATRADLARLGIQDFRGLVPDDVFSWSRLASLPGLVMVLVGGFLIGFGARYAGGCTSGHGITGLATFQPASLIAVVGFFVGGLVATYFLLPLLL